MKNWIITSPKYESDNLNSMLAVSPWAGHRNFAYDLINFMQPDVIVELGSHFGGSLFSFCQSVKDNKLNSKIIAIDTWEGDPQAGFYGDEVFTMVKTTANECFKSVDLKLDKRTFQAAVESMGDMSIDLLHIDGLHTYEAVSDDFKTWLPKLKENGIILFHDTAAYTGYGSHVFWEEIKQFYPSFEFNHSWGLGILFPKGDKWYDLMLKSNFLDKILLYSYKAKFELAQIQVHDLEKMSNERYQAMKEMEILIQKRDEIIESQSKLLEERLISMNEMEAMVRERDEVIESQSKLVEERLISMNEMEAMVRERDEIIESQSKLVEDRLKSMNDMEEMIRERDKIIESQSKLVEDRLNAMNEMEEMIKERDEIIESQSKLVEDRLNAMNEMEEMIKERDEIIKSQVNLVEERLLSMNEMEQMIRERDQTITELDKNIKE
ncbi:class I SAM-dependent methyltransferase [Paenibacillus sp. T3-5-0-4]|uniref:CmcI family methyltransferase n=1 Tax=Paenibacillus endoradicis TaxID=2972487 RepID=UPI00215961D1|nr:CmcI family methyltransferase [Paenibacillus endoradicis]MCR8659820.1 class I SAM-dependent methyltransferase [Paenibacillus endoradicis]